MKLRTVWSVVVFALLVSVSSAFAASPVWKVSKGDARLYIGGTVHVLSKTDYPLPAGFDVAYKQAAQLVFETDMQKMSAPETQQLVLQQAIYADGRNLKQVLNPQTFQELEKFLAARKIPVAEVVGLKPGMLAVTLTMVELQRLGMGGTGVDSFYQAQAVSDHKHLGQLEAVEEQIGFLGSLGEGYESELISYTLRDIKELPRIMPLIKAAWRQGDLRKLEELGLAPLKQEFPPIYQTLIVKRNKAWLPRIEEMLKNADVEFVLVGALHLVGEDGLLAQLAARGYQIQKLD
ncbi:MAG: TraB/GumN family protein [Geobacteraceae bacterium]|nr:TraB/GumN family protein [Geobacteraceae bacterium]